MDFYPPGLSTTTTTSSSLHFLPSNQKVVIVTQTFSSSRQASIIFFQHFQRVLSKDAGSANWWWKTTASFRFLPLSRQTRSVWLWLDATIEIKEWEHILFKTCFFLINNNNNKMSKKWVLTKRDFFIYFSFDKNGNCLTSRTCQSRDVREAPDIGYCWHLLSLFRAWEVLLD